VRRIDAPAPGWFPDPENRARLRWWDGTDWTDIFRAVPSTAEVAAHAEIARTGTAGFISTVGDEFERARRPAGDVDTQRVIEEVRTAARSELDRAADLFTRRADAAVQRYTPLISDYTNRLVRWIKIAAIVATILLIAWFVFQTIAEATFFEWLGDRIDNLTDQDDGAALSAT
jgi:hypothetical protein